MKIFQYMPIHHKYSTSEIWSAYNLTNSHFELRGFAKGMYGLKIAAVLTTNIFASIWPLSAMPLSHTLLDYGTTPRVTPPSRSPSMTLVSNILRKHDADQLFDALATKYDLTKDWSGTSYLDFTINWNYTYRWVDISVPGYVSKAMHTLQNPMPYQPQHSPYRWTAPAYGQKVQLANNDLTPLLDKLGIKRVQQISCLILYYSRGCDPAFIAALNEMSNN
jgi:hypothetical protein